MSKLFLQAAGENLCVSDPTMAFVYDTRLERIISAQATIGNDAFEAFQLRGETNTCRETTPLFLCPECNNPLSLKMWKDRSGFFFSHAIANDDCPIKDESRLSRKVINARKYRGKNESALHDNLKRMLESCLNADSDFSNPQRERWWKSVDGCKHRQPDVQADYKEDLHIAFEIQLSTTYADVIADRMNFARQNKGLLIWIVNKMDWKDLRTAVMDTLSANNGNIYVFDDEMYKISLGCKKLHLKCLWLKLDEGDCNRYTSNEKIITFDELTFDIERQWAYYFDFSKEKERGQQDVSKHKLDEYKPPSILDIDAWNPKWGTEDVVNFLGAYYDDATMNAHDAKVVINMLLSAIWGHPRGWDFNNNKQLFHNLYEYYKKFVVMFSFIENSIYSELSRDEKIWAKKKDINRDLKIQKAHSKFYPSQDYDIIIEKLFPREYEMWLAFRKEFGI